MSELTLYQLHPEAWVFVMAKKYLSDSRFDQVLADFQSVLTVEEMELAREMWKENSK